MRKLGSLFVITLSTAFAACEPPAVDAPTSSVTITDSAGITIIDNGEIDRTGSSITLSDSVLRIGVLSGAEEYQLFQVGDIKLLSDGAVVVANRGTREVKVFEADGTHRVTFGGRGEGPREFRSLSAVTILGNDTIQVQDLEDRALFTSDGTYLDRITRDVSGIQALVDRPFSWSGWAADGSAMGVLYDWEANIMVVGPMSRSPIIILRIKSDLVRIDTLGVFGAMEQQYIDVGAAFPTSIIPPYPKNSYTALGSPDGTIVVSDNAVPQFELFHPDGSHSIVRWAQPADPISDSEIEAWKDRQRAIRSPEQLVNLERVWGVMDVPETKPFHHGTAAGSDRVAWVKWDASRVGQARFSAFQPDGRFIGTLRIPSNFSLRDSGPGWVAGLVRDENDVEYVYVYRYQVQ